MPSVLNHKCTLCNNGEDQHHNPESNASDKPLATMTRTAN